MCRPDFKRRIKTQEDETGEREVREVSVIVAVVQDFYTDRVLMQGFMDGQAWDKTLATLRLHLWSLSRDELWDKGATSGNFVEVKEVWLDCDRDTALIRGIVHGDGNICHTGRKTCFFIRVL